MLRIDPAANPAITDTGTWSPAAAAATVRRLPADHLRRVSGAIRGDGSVAPQADLTLHAGSITRGPAGAFALGQLADGQQVLLEVRADAAAPALDGSLLDVRPGDGSTVAFYPTNAANLSRYLREIAPSKAPRALGATPRLGVGCRMTTACWPGILGAMDRHRFAANPIQNSVRELNFLSDVAGGLPPERNYASGFGMIEAGYTGSTFEGLWVWGVLEALKYPAALPYGADADHVQVKRGPEGLARALRYLDACRRYTFFTIDVADVLDYAALLEPSDAAARERAQAAVGDEALHRLIVDHHRRERPGAGTYEVPAPLVDRLIAKHWRALEALGAIEAHLRFLKAGEQYDLELAIDEHPPEVPAFDCLTSEEECAFLLSELRRRGLPITHLAPNVGMEKGHDYRGRDGLVGLRTRLAALGELAAAAGVMVDVHSADDLTWATRATIRRATGGRLHYKISPMLQIVFAAVLEDVHPDLFREWWRDAVEYAEAEAAGGSGFARACLAGLGPKSRAPSHRDLVFHHYSFRFVGRRDASGRFLHRKRFYRLSPEFHRVHEDRVVEYLSGLAGELLG